ncbi:hypothetical protein HNY73_012335 [Argiope bruennichi]|uniref:ISXO2-like transposase domain-containing protein n=1 Tax=Argiope bruennichi TaxID=94029 RepID=A0A8T0EZD1_ARGBR|nr:hypothetical protein HNY73_012335 [Argiope bruennichi]
MRRESIVNDLNVAARMVTDWVNFCRGVYEDACLAFDEKIDGIGKIVEIDESKFGKRKYNRGKRVEGQWVFGGLVRYTNDCFFEVVPERSADVLLEVIKRRILPGRTVISDCWASYNCLDNEGYQHSTDTKHLNTKLTSVDDILRGLYQIKRELCALPDDVDLKDALEFTIELEEDAQEMKVSLFVFLSKYENKSETVCTIPKANIKIPDLRLPTFNGKFQESGLFKSQFMKVIRNKPSLDET